jgi:hypothetical protein
LVKTFRKATTLEIGFWQMVLLLEPWDGCHLQ